MSKQKVSIIITDLDNTLYDWFDQWYQSFNAMLQELIRISNISEATLLEEIKEIHKRHGTSEYSFVIEEIPSLRKKHPEGNLTNIYNEAIHKYRSARKASLRLYPDVMETMRTLRQKGCLIIAYTESMAFYSNYRIRTLGLDGIIDILYSPSDHDFPEKLTPEQIRLYPPEHYQFAFTEHYYTPKGELKPNPGILNNILGNIGARKEEAIYIGDSLIKDIIMAQKLNITDVFAKYGVAHNQTQYELLRKVTHWSEEHVENEKHTDEKSIVPTYTLENSFKEILDIFEFIPFKGRFPSFEVKLSDKLDVWKKTVDVQQHFNDLELRIRNFAITIVGALLGVAAFSIKEHLSVQLYALQLPIASILVFVGLFIWIAFYIMDRHWYHRLLLGAVKHGEFIEKRLSTMLPEIMLAHSIRHESSNRKLFGIFNFDTKKKMDIFYGLVALGLFLLAIILFFGVNDSTLSDNNKNIHIEKSSKINNDNETIIKDTIKTGK
jgi:FMN phosphatase YigB (HAD superfamily)